MTAELASTRLGMLTPSSNTVLEPLNAAMLSELPDASAHFARFRILKISMEDDALGQFKNEPMLAAAELLADAQVQSICWNGTSSGWLGFDTDRTLIAEVPFTNRWGWGPWTVCHGLPFRPRPRSRPSARSGSPPRWLRRVA